MPGVCDCCAREPGACGVFAQGDEPHAAMFCFSFLAKKEDANIRDKGGGKQEENQCFLPENVHKN